MRKGLAIVQNMQYVHRAFANTRREMIISLGFVLALTMLLAWIFYLVESIAQPDVFTNYFDAFVWAYTRYIEGGDGVFDGGPITVTGKVIASLFGFIGIAIVAIPAGLIGSGFMDAVQERKRANDLAEYRTRLHKAFRRRQCRYTKAKVVPRFVSVTTIQAKQQMDIADIIDAVNTGKDFRLRNLAGTRQLQDQVDRLVVEHFPLSPDTPYGCCIDRKSKITIVSTSSVQETGIGNFAYYVALFGGFNYVSKEIDVNIDEPTSFYVMENPEDEASNTKRFVEDVRKLATGDGHWTIFLLSASGGEEPVYPTQLHFIYGAKKGDDGYNDPNLTICDTERFETFYQNLSAVMHDEYQYESDKHRYHTGAGKKNIARRIGGGEATNAFTIRLAYAMTVWDDRNIAIAQTIAAAITRDLEGKEWTAKDEWREAGYGY